MTASQAGIAALSWVRGGGHVPADGGGGYFVSDDRGLEALACASGSKVLSQVDLGSAPVRQLIFTSTIFEPTAVYPRQLASEVAIGLGLGSVDAFSVQHAYCASPFLAVRLMKAWLERRAEPTFGLVICSDRLGTAGARWRRIGQGGYHSDAAMAMVLSNHGPRYLIRDVSLSMDNARYRGLDDNALVVADRFYMAFLARLIAGMFQRNCELDASMTALFTNNLDAGGWQAIASKYGISANRVYTSPEHGHMFGADPFVNFSEFGAQAEAKGLRHALLCASGVGGVFAAMLLDGIKSEQFNE